MNQQPNLFLSILRNCNPRARFDAWQRDGGALLGNRNIGCGINSLTFLEVFTRQQGENLVRVINRRGTTFQEMMNYVFNSNGGNPQFEVRFNITNVERTQSLIDFLQDDNTLPRGSCTIAKMMRYDDNTPPERVPLFNGSALTSGHSIIFSKDEEGVLHAIDPQQGTRRRSDDANRAFNVWSGHYYQWVCLMFSQQPLDASVPMEVDDEPSNISLLRLPDHGPIPMDVVSDIDEIDEPMDVDGGMGKINKKLRRIKNKIKTNKIRKIKNKKIRKTRTNSRNMRRRKHYL
jgi:hypothetical protein